jgi:hypothetical protein
MSEKHFIVQIYKYLQTILAAEVHLEEEQLLVEEPTLNEQNSLTETPNRDSKTNSFHQEEDIM